MLGLRRPRSLQSFRQAEVQDLHRAVGADLDVGGFQIAMDDALLMRGFDGVGDLSGDGDGVIDGNRSGGDPLRQVRTIHELHDQGLDRRTVLETVNLRDVRMIE